MGPAEKAKLVGSNRTLLALGSMVQSIAPPASSTLASGSRVAECIARGTGMSAIVAKAWAAMLNTAAWVMGQIWISSNGASDWNALKPPAISTSPLASSVAECRAKPLSSTVAIAVKVWVAVAKVSAVWRLGT